MKIEHAAILYRDLDKAKRFFEDYFGASAGKLYRNEKMGFSSYFLTFENGCRLEIMNRPEAKESKEKTFWGFLILLFPLAAKKLLICLRNDCGMTVFLLSANRGSLVTVTMKA